MKYYAIATILIVFIAYSIWYDEGNFQNETSSNTAEIVDVPDQKTNLAHSSKAKLQKVDNSQKPKSNSLKKHESTFLNAETAMQGLTTLLENASNGSVVDIKFEKSLITYLRNTDDRDIYNYILNKLNNAELSTPLGDSLVEYTISLLAAINTSSASKLMLDVVNTKNWQGSEAVYLVKKAISRFNRSGDFTELVQQAYAESSDTSPYLNELATSIAKNARGEQVQYLFDYIDSKESAKNIAARNALNTIQTESLVPNITQHLSSDSTEKVNVALSSLANMGQYEAASALITWSAAQSLEAKSTVASLFEVALRRSPSTKRAIKKEVLPIQFANNEIKGLILSYVTDKNIEED
ncbi:hypothetical protein [Cognaticolwellia beringensis]|uniref:HEAT repeat domain-containing protein n=1 Tax=Cognaticolwellia beringensis TaxID=1967665 RepID=A0A222G8C9_9GAMM|nr:hypothetical protein [Cognaticolwellia beringensis]ASP48158.1 hypothetical protein B5D82_10535 [Cognaticolwellia beringensis]